MNTKKLDTQQILRDFFYYESYRRPSEDITTKAGSHEDIQNRLKGLLTLASADRELSEKEKNWILGSALAKGCSVPFVEELNEYRISKSDNVLQKVRNTIRSDSDAIGMIYNAIRACSADGILAKEERHKIIEFAKKLELSDEIINEIFSIFEAENALKNKIGKLIG